MISPIIAAVVIPFLMFVVYWYTESIAFMAMTGLTLILIYGVIVL